MKLVLTVLLGFDPRLAASADTIPEQVPSPVVIVSPPGDSRILRGDYEAADEVLLVYTDSWPRAVEDVAKHVLDSGAGVGLAREVDSSRAGHARLLRRLDARGTGWVEGLGTAVDTPWVRDWGPLQSYRPSVSAPINLWLDADYNDADRVNDDDAPLLLGAHYRAPVVELPWPLDGGAVISNGEGLCALTLEYLESEGIVFDEEDLGRMLSQLGCRVTALIPTLVDEPTKHVDMIAQFVAPNRVMLAELADDLDGGDSEDALRLAAAEVGLRRAATAMGVTLDIVHVPTPASGRWDPPYSYVNGLRLSDRYLMPSYPELGSGPDLFAWDAVQTALGEVPVVPIVVSDMIDSGGAIHCAALGLFF